MADQGLGQTSYSSIGMNQPTPQVGNYGNASPSSVNSPPYPAPSQLPMTPAPNSGSGSVGAGFFAQHKRTIIILLVVTLVVCSLCGVYHFFFKSETFKNTNDEKRKRQLRRVRNSSQDLQSPYAAY